MQVRPQANDTKVFDISSSGRIAQTSRRPAEEGRAEEGCCGADVGLSLLEICIILVTDWSAIPSIWKIDRSLAIRAAMHEQVSREGRHGSCEGGEPSRLLLYYIYKTRPAITGVC